MSYLTNPFWFVVAGADPINMGGNDSSGGYGTNCSTYSAAGGWVGKTNFPAGVSLTTVGGNADNAISATGGYGNTSYKFYGATNTWSANLVCSYTSHGSAGGGTQDNMIVFGGNQGGGTALTTTAEYVGSSWTNVGNMNSARRECGGGGGDPDNAIVICGERLDFTDYDSVETWNGSTNAWTTSGTVFPYAFNNGIYFGTSTDGVGGMGDASGTKKSDTYETTDGGATWTNLQNNTYSAYGVGAAGVDSSSGVSWCGQVNVSTPYGSTYTNDYSSATGWGTSGNTFPYSFYQARGHV